MTIKVYCKKQQPGELLFIPYEWQVMNYHYEKGFIPAEDLKSSGVVRLPDCTYCEGRHPWFFTMFLPDYRSPSNLQELCDSIFDEDVLTSQSTFWLLYYYDGGYYDCCLLSAEENYFEGTEYEVIEVNINE